MKLEENNYTDKNGVARTTYKVKKLNEYGNGITVDTRIEFELSFQPIIRPVNFTDKKTGKPKSFDSVNILAKPSVTFDNIVFTLKEEDEASYIEEHGALPPGYEQYKQYGNAAFQLPPNYSPWIAECQPGDIITVWLRSFTVMDDGKEVVRSTWDCLVNGVSPKKQDNKPAMSFNKPQPTTEAQAIPQEIAEMNKEVGINVPGELRQWLNTLKENKENFKGAFANNYDGFVQWIRSAPDCGTDYYVNKSDVEIQALYKELNEKL